jgi:hypothetical protein
MRSRFTLLAACVLALAVPSAASAAFTVGISENRAQMFSDPLFLDLGARQARVVVAYDVALHPGSDDFTRITHYLAAAKATGVEPLFALEHERGDASRCDQKKNFTKSICKLPSTKAYEKAVKAFFATFPDAKVIAPWNEANHFTQPTSRNPKTAAKFTDIVAKQCKTCKIVVADMLDQADNPAAARPTFVKTAAYIKTFRSALKTKRGICGIHNYSDVNRFRTSGTKALIKVLGCKEYWLTETGGLYNFGSFWTKKTRKGCTTSAACQLKATKYLFSAVKRNTKIKRVYIYTWYPGTGARFDAGLTTATGTARPALAEVKKHT